MFNDVIKFSYRDCDLPPAPERWEGESYEQRRNTIHTFIEKQTGFPPSPNMKAVREGVFKVEDTTTIEELVALGRKLKEWYKIDCFQCTIDRTDNTAHMLFDWNDRDALKSIVINRSEQIALSVMILRYLNLPSPKGTDLWYRYFLTGEHGDDPDVFNSVLEQVKHKNLGKRGYRIIYYALRYVQQMCEGLVK